MDVQPHRGSPAHPLHELLERVDDVADQPVWVRCASGFRASIAASILDAAGKDVIAIVDDFSKAGRNGLPLVSEQS